MAAGCGGCLEGNIGAPRQKAKQRRLCGRGYGPETWLMSALFLTCPVPRPIRFLVLRRVGIALA
jgi:hypothetical protein